MKNKELYTLKDGINQVSHLGGADFAIGVIKNLKLVEKEIEVLDAIIKTSKDFEEKYQPAVEKIARIYCKKDEKGNPLPRITRSGQALYEFTPEAKIDFDAAIKALEEKEEFVEIVKFRKNQETKFEEALEKECTIQFVKVKKEYIPKDIKIGELNSIYLILEEF
jgi:hypothetical protein